MSEHNTAQAAPMLTAGDVARRLGFAKPTVYRKLSRGEIPSLRVGRSVRVDPAELDRWIREGGTR
jgi:putative molybdopterin biosynthesis protein